MPDTFKRRKKSEKKFRKRDAGIEKTKESLFEQQKVFFHHAAFQTGLAIIHAGNVSSGTNQGLKSK